MGQSDDIDGNPLGFQGGGEGSDRNGLPDDIFAKLGRIIHRGLDPLARYLCYGAAIVTLLMSLFMVVDLISRLVFNNPLSGMIELQTFMLVIMAFFSIAYTMLKNQHVAVDLITSALSAPVNSVLQSVFS
ncbi:MAG: TRAP transporter small permease, partial [Paracoccaceae bacterium]